MGPRARVHLLSCVTWARARCPEASNSFLGDSGPGRRDRGVDQGSRATLACAVGPGGRPVVMGDWSPGAMACGIDQLSRVTRARV